MYFIAVAMMALPATWVKNTNNLYSKYVYCSDIIFFKTTKRLYKSRKMQIVFEIELLSRIWNKRSLHSEGK